MSHPAGMRGLKQERTASTSTSSCVASRRDAWIETFNGQNITKITQVASRRDAWIETAHLSQMQVHLEVASRRDAWIET